MDIDTSTINRAKLESLPLAVLPRTHRLSDSIGSGCYGDPPGYPSYFIAHVYTQHGNAPTGANQATATILGRVLERARDNYEARPAKLRALWSPLPIDHPRTVAWIRHTYSNFRGCYSVPDRLEYGRPETLIKGLGPFEHHTYDDDPRFSEEYKAANRAAVDAYNRDVDAQWARIAIPENHCAARRIREFYPEHAPDLELIAHPPAEIEGDWWEVYAERPTPETCPGKVNQWSRMTMQHLEHPLGGGDWCQVCGWHASGGTVRP